LFKLVFELKYNYHLTSRIKMLDYHT